MIESAFDPEEFKAVRNAVTRERERRRLAEKLLEEKSRELYASYKSLERAHKDLKDSQKQLVQSEKMASLGVMSAGVAHEINTPVGFVQSNVNTLAEYLPVYMAASAMLTQLLDAIETESPLDKNVRAKAKETRDYLIENEMAYLMEDTQSLVDETRDGLKRISDIVAGLSTFARAESSNQEEFELNDCIKSSISMVESKNEARCRLAHHLESKGKLLGNEGRIGQVLVNLIANALHAIPEDKSDGLVSIRSYDDGNDVVVSVADNGSGIAQENLEKLFTPFFTTKPVGEGTGLGLSISFGIVQEHGGSIEVESEPDVGTEFKVRLPMLKIGGRPRFSIESPDRPSISSN